MASCGYRYRNREPAYDVVLDLALSRTDVPLEEELAAVRAQLRHKSVQTYVKHDRATLEIGVPNSTGLSSLPKSY